MLKNISARQIEWCGRIALAVIFIWFGVLKIFGVSPANQLVHDLLVVTLPFISYSGFIIFLGIWEAGIGVLFLFPKLTRWAFWIMIAQMCTTLGPLVFLPDATWQTFLLVPTMEGQYIIKNLALLSVAITVYQLPKLIIHTSNTHDR